MQQEREYHTLRRNDGSVVVYYTLDNDPAHYVVYDTLDARALAAEVERLSNLANHLSEVIQDERTKGENRKEANGLLSRRNKKLEAEVARLQAQVEAMESNLKNCIVFLDKIGIDPIKVKRDDGIDMLYFGEELLSQKTIAYLKRQRAALGGSDEQ